MSFLTPRFFAACLAAISAILGAVQLTPALDAASEHDPSPVAVTRFGKVRGYVDHDIASFKGIHYGADTASHRFMAPRPPIPWSGVRPALQFGPMAPQGLDKNEVFFP